jgi:hypothetical protein
MGVGCRGEGGEAAGERIEGCLARCEEVGDAGVQAQRERAQAIRVAYHRKRRPTAP